MGRKGAVGGGAGEEMTIIDTRCLSVFGGLGKVDLYGRVGGSQGVLKSVGDKENFIDGLGNEGGKLGCGRGWLEGWVGFEGGGGCGVLQGGSGRGIWEGFGVVGGVEKMMVVRFATEWSLEGDGEGWDVEVEEPLVRAVGGTARP